MKRFTLYIIVVFVVFSCGQKRNKQSKELLIFGAASLTNVITELAQEFEENYQIPVQLNFASSGTLARQIEHGAKPSIFISANEKWVDYLINIDLLEPETKYKIAGSSLVVIAPVESSISSLPFDKNLANAFSGRLAMGDPKHVPAGEYAWQAIKKADLVDSLKDRLLPTRDVRSALMVVELGEAEMGIVYKTDALKSDKVKLVCEIPDGSHLPIGFYSSILSDKNIEQSQLFYNFLSSNKAKTIWLKNGFTLE